MNFKDSLQFVHHYRMIKALFQPESKTIDKSSTISHFKNFIIQWEQLIVTPFEIHIS